MPQHLDAGRSSDGECNNHSHHNNHNSHSNHNSNNHNHPHLDEKEQRQFLQGFKFIVKYIGTMEVPRPISRLEIVSAMRRIRYDFKTRSVKKRYVEMSVSLAGVHVYLQTKSKLKKAAQETCHSSPNPILKNPIHRIFYVSHDSKDTKIFSYIAKEEETNLFRCSVFKALKKCQAGEIVKTIGQAFEVSHVTHQVKRSMLTRESERNQSDADSLLSLPTCSAREETEVENSQMRRESSKWSPLQEQEAHNSNNNGGDDDDCDLDIHQDVSESSTSEGHMRAAMKQKLKIRCQEITFLKSQNKVLQRQLEVEMHARKQAEATTQLLISQNQELLCQLDVLLKKLSKYEKTLLLMTTTAATTTTTKSKNLDLTASCPVHSCLSTEDMEKSEMKNSPDSGLNETSCEESQLDAWSGPGPTGVDNEAATSTPEKGGLEVAGNAGHPAAGGPRERAVAASLWKHKSKVSQFFAARSKANSSSAAAAGSKRSSNSGKNRSTNRKSTAAAAAADCDDDDGCVQSSAKKFSSKERHLLNHSPTTTTTTTTKSPPPTTTPPTKTTTTTSVADGRGKNSSEIHLKFTPSQSKSCKKFKLEKMISIRKSLGDSTTELELSFGD